MSRPDQTPSLASIAFQYGTITKHQYQQFSAFISGRKFSVSKEAELLMGQGLATRYQVGLLKLIRDYQIIRTKGEIFGRIALEKGYVTEANLKKAMAIQRNAFRDSRLKKLIGDILVDKKIISEDQKLRVLREQTLLEQKIRAPILKDSAPENSETENDELGLSRYEKEFLKIKALDEDFSAALLEKGIAQEADVTKARQVQEDAFEQENTIKILGDIMVDLNMISQEEKEIIFKEQGRLSDSGETESFTLKIAPDQMSAWIHRESSEKTIGLADIKAAIKKAGIIDGIYPDSLIQCALEEDSGITMFPVAKKDYSQRIRESCGLVLYLSQGLSETGEKKKGDLLSEETGDNKPGPVTNILGEPSEKISNIDFTIRCGSGARRSRTGKKLLAAKTGQPALSVERLLYIHPVIHVLEDADQRYGPIEAYANLNVSGTITGAYPITAGHVNAKEIRGGRIVCIGNVTSDVGITDAVIRAQGDIKARYLHNCRIELFGNLYIENEIFDSDIRCSGKIDSPNCRVVSSRLYAKQGITLGGIGSEKTGPCLLSSGTEHHLFSQLLRLTEEIKEVQQAFDRLEETRQKKAHDAKRTFEKMIELKIFHDRAKQLKLNLIKDLKSKGPIYKPEKKKNIVLLIENFENRMKKAVQRLKELNHLKKKQDKSVEKLDEKLTRLTPVVEKQVIGLKQIIYAYFEWARFQPGDTRIDIRGKAYAGTTFKGVWSMSTLDLDQENFILREKDSGSGSYEMTMD